MYDIPSSRQAGSSKTKCGIYDIPPSQKKYTPVLPLPSTPNYDIVPPPRPVSGGNSVYDVPPIPKLVKNKMRTNSRMTDASPKSRADYNTPLAYVDLSQYDGCEEDEKSSTYININSNLLTSRHKFSRSKSCDTSNTYDTPKAGRHTSSVPLYDKSRLKTVTLSEVVLCKPVATSQSTKKPTAVGEANNLEKMKKIAKSADSVHAFAKQELSVSVASHLLLFAWSKIIASC